MNTDLSNEIDEALHRVGAHGMHLTRGVDDDLTFHAVAVTYGVVDTYDTVFAPGVFKQSLQQRMPRLAWSHNWNDIIGVATRVVRDDAKSLELAFKLDDPSAVPNAAKALAQLKSKSVDHVSVGFFPEEATDIQHEGRTVLRFDRATLDEVSLVLRGAVPGAVVTDTSALRAKALHMIRSHAHSNVAVPAAAVVRTLSSAEIVGIVNDCAAPLLRQVQTNAKGTPWLHFGEALALAEDAVRAAAKAMHTAPKRRQSMEEAIADYEAAYGTLSSRLDAEDRYADDAPSTLDIELEEAIALARNAANRK